MNYGAFRSLWLTNRQCIFERKADGERILVAVNADSEPCTAYFDAGCRRATDLLCGLTQEFAEGALLPPCSAFFWRCED